MFHFCNCGLMILELYKSFQLFKAMACSPLKLLCMKLKKLHPEVTNATFYGF